MSFHKKLCLLLFVLGIPSTLQASVSDQLARAAEDGSVAFVLVTAPGASGMDEAQQLIRSAMGSVPGSALFAVDRASSTEASFVAKYRLTTAPLPLILVFASNGALAGGQPASKLTSDQLVAMVPSPKKAETIKAVQNGQAVYLTASRAGMPSAATVASVCAAACTEMQGKCVSVAVDMDDPAEKVFLDQLKIDRQSTEPVTIIVNAQGQLAGSFNGPVEVSQLVGAASKQVSSGCCPTGSGKSCGPTPPKAGG